MLEGAIALLAAACSSGADKNSSLNQLPVTPKTSASGALPNPENPLAVLGLPFPKDSRMVIQQAWTSPFELEHHAIDFIRGKIDDSGTWQSFQVDAAADGFACANPEDRKGNAVFMEHHVENNPLKPKLGFTYYGHLKKIEQDIPACESKDQPKFKKQGAKLGDAGSTGAQDAAWIHLHFAVKNSSQNPIDPYDLKGERGVYPDPNFKNGKPCGPNALFKDCYPKGAVVASPKSPIPPIGTPKIGEAKSSEKLETKLYTDMGNPSSESKFSLTGWGVAQVPPDQKLISPSGDKTKRYQLLRGNNIIAYPVDPNHNYRLTAEVEDGGCTDNFQILANGVLLYNFVAQSGNTTIRIHTTDIPQTIIKSNGVIIDFRNTATDNCGLAAVFNVKVESK